MQTLTDEQIQVKNKLLDFIFDDDKSEIILQGHAGTGKSFLLQHLYEDYQSMTTMSNALGITPKDWQFCATTHKAVEALHDKGIQAKTIHSYFGLNIYDNPIGKYVNTANTIVVIDECSYLNYLQLAHIQNHCDKVIYVGDKNQLTPVGLNHAPVFYSDIDMVELTQTVRQQNAPNIAEYCEKLRYAITHGKETPKLNLSPEIVHLNQQQFNQKVSEDFEHYTGDRKILGLKNTTVQKYNKMLSKGITVGTLLVNNSFHKYLHIPNNYTVEVVDVYDDTQVLGVKVISCRIKAQGVEHDVYIPKTATGMARAYKQAKETSNMVLYQYFADLREPYAQTIHKAQGSTYKEVYIHLDDLKTIKDTKERNRLLYVAFSRATDKVYLTGGLP